MITLHGFGAAFNLPDPSPFVTRVELLMRVSNIEYQRIDSARNLQKAPKSKLPFIIDDGKMIADSVFIADYLRSNYDVRLDDWLSNEQAALAQLLSKSLDENLYWVIVYSRWVLDEVWPNIEAEFFGSIPFPLNKIIAWSARSSTCKKIKSHGIGQHSQDEISTIAHASWKSLSTLLGDKPYFFGEKISSFDITAFSMLSAFTLIDLDTPFNDDAKAYKNLVDFTHRIAKEYYPNEISL